MDDNSLAIIALCSHLGADESTKPLEPGAWSKLAQKLMEAGHQPQDILGCSAEAMARDLNVGLEEAERLRRLADRSGSIGFALTRYEKMGIRVVTRADKEYPKHLKKKLGSGCPPLFYYAGPLSLLNEPAAGFVGARTVSQKDIDFTVHTVHATLRQGYQVVSGGAKGVDQIAQQEALAQGGTAVAYLSDSLLRKIKAPDILQALGEERLLLLSVVKPDAGFNTGVAMMRNRYIYSQSVGTVVVRSDLKKGGTWSGATENLRYNWCTTYCWDCADYPGNQALIEKGAIPIGLDWDGSMVSTQKQEKEEQISLFDM